MRPLRFGNGVAFAQVVDSISRARVGARQRDGGGDILHITARPTPPAFPLADKDRLSTVIHSPEVIEQTASVAGTVNLRQSQNSEWRLRVAHHDALNRNLVVMVSQVFPALRRFPIRIKPRAQWRFFVVGRRLKLSLFEPQKQPVGAIHILTAHGDDAFGIAAKGRHQQARILFDVRDHIEYDLSPESIELAAVFGQSPAVADDAQSLARQIASALPTMKNRDGMPIAEQPSQNVGADKPCPADYQNAHDIRLSSVIRLAARPSDRPSSPAAPAGNKPVGPLP